jgi:hypothetical protein
VKAAGLSHVDWLGMILKTIVESCVPLAASGLVIVSWVS